MRCLSATEARCSPASLFGDAPVLDVPYAETRPAVVAKMLDLATLRPGERLVDLGTGDGRILLTAAARGAGGIGVDIDPVLVAEANAAAIEQGVADRATFRVENLFDTPLHDADVVTMFLLPEVNLKLRPRLLADARPGTRVVSHAFTMGDWSPDGVARVGGSRLYLWIVPAKVAGRWRLDDGRTLTLRQRYQRVAGELDGAPIADARLVGDRLAFAVGSRRHVATVRGGGMAGNGWRATRAAVHATSNNPAAPIPPAVHIDTTT